MRDYSKQIDKFWPTIMQAWEAHADKRPVIECDLVGKNIREVSMNEEYERITPADKLRESIGPDDGPLCRHINSEGEQRSFDAKCGKLYRFLEKRKAASHR